MSVREGQPIVPSSAAEGNSGMAPRVDVEIGARMAPPKTQPQARTTTHLQTHPATTAWTSILQPMLSPTMLVGGNPARDIRRRSNRLRNISE